MEFSSSRRNGDGSEIVAARTTSFPSEDVLFVALGKDVKESETVLKWALENSHGKKMCILHIHQPAERIPSGITMLQRSMVDESRVKAQDGEERQKMHKLLDSYVLTCEKAGVEATKVNKESSCIEKGIVELIVEKEVKWLVMGAAANKHSSRKMKELKSKKAKYVRKEAPSFCHIWFVCKGNLICTRECKPNTIAVKSPPFQGTPDTSASTSSTPCRVVGNSQVEDSQIAYQRAHSDSSYMSQSLHGSESASPQSPLSRYPKLNPERKSSQRRSFSVISQISPQSALVKTGENAAVSLPCATEGIEDGLKSLSMEASNDELYDRLHQFATEAETYKKEAYNESIKRKKAEKEAIEANRRFKAAEAMHSQKVRSLEETLSKSREDVENARMELNGLMNEIRIAQELKSSLENQVLESDRTVLELEKKMFLAVDLLQKYKKKRGELKIERGDALREVETLRKTSSSSCPQLFMEFSYSEIKKATNNFSSSCKIGEGGYGDIYLANLRHTKMAVKTLKPWSSQGPLQFHQEVNILSKLRHPNIVSLIGACPEECTLIQEYIPGGNLEDRLNCKGNTPPLTWKTRIRIASELCSALIFMHSCVPQGIVHGDLKPSNVLLDANCVSKLCDFGASQELAQDEDDTARCFWLDQATGTQAYIAPEVLQSGELTARSDVYSFGVILLRLLSGKPGFGGVESSRTDESFMRSFVFGGVAVLLRVPHLPGNHERSCGGW